MGTFRRVPPRTSIASYPAVVESRVFLFKNGHCGYGRHCVSVSETNVRSRNVWHACHAYVSNCMFKKKKKSGCAKFRSEFGAFWFCVSHGKPAGQASSIRLPSGRPLPPSYPAKNVIKKKKHCGLSRVPFVARAAALGVL